MPGLEPHGPVQPQSVRQGGEALAHGDISSCALTWLGRDPERSLHPTPGPRQHRLQPHLPPEIPQPHEELLSGLSSPRRGQVSLRSALICPGSNWKPPPTLPPCHLQAKSTQLFQSHLMGRVSICCSPICLHPRYRASPPLILGQVFHWWESCAFSLQQPPPYQGPPPPDLV